MKKEKKEKRERFNVSKSVSLKLKERVAGDVTQT